MLVHRLQLDWGDYVGGRLRIAGTNGPLHIRSHAVVLMAYKYILQDCPTVTDGRLF